MFEDKRPPFRRIDFGTHFRVNLGINHQYYTGHPYASHGRAIDSHVPLLANRGGLSYAGGHQGG